MAPLPAKRLQLLKNYFLFLAVSDGDVWVFLLSGPFQKHRAEEKTYALDTATTTTKTEKRDCRCKGFAVIGAAPPCSLARIGI